MTYKENIKAILECNFTGFKDEIIDTACDRIIEIKPYDTFGYRGDIKDYLEQTNTILITKDAFEKLKEIANVFDKIKQKEQNEQTN